MITAATPPAGTTTATANPTAVPALKVPAPGDVALMLMLGLTRWVAVILPDPVVVVPDTTPSGLDAVVTVVPLVASVDFLSDVLPDTVRVVLVAVVVPMVFGVGGGTIVQLGTHKFRFLSAAFNPLVMNDRTIVGSPFSIVIVTVY